MNTDKVLDCGKILGEEVKPELLPFPGKSGEWPFWTVNPGAHTSYKCLQLDGFLVRVFYLGYSLHVNSLPHDSA